MFYFKKKTATGNKQLHVPQQFDTRWISKYKRVNVLKLNSTLRQENEVCRGLLYQLTSFGNITILVCLDKIPQCGNILCIQLQSSTIGIGKSLKLIEATMSRLMSFQTDDQFEECYKEAVKIENMNQIEVTARAFHLRTQKVSSRLEDYLTMETIGNGRIAANNTEKNKDES
ncbi:hypothetical protein J6590_084936 [Homalodisca vitripennis]|nr:hypothetical protein J6590_084936 [Homalodisca vitripennis]